MIARAARPSPRPGRACDRRAAPAARRQEGQLGALLAGACRPRPVHPVPATEPRVPRGARPPSQTRPDHHAGRWLRPFPRVPVRMPIRRRRARQQHPGRPDARQLDRWRAGKGALESPHRPVHGCCQRAATLGGCPRTPRRCGLAGAPVRASGKFAEGRVNICCSVILGVGASTRLIRQLISRTLEPSAISCLATGNNYPRGK